MRCDIHSSGFWSARLTGPQLRLAALFARGKLLEVGGCHSIWSIPMKRFFLCCLAMTYATTATGTSAVLDQAYETYGGFVGGDSRGYSAQTFVVGQTGKLVKVELALFPGDVPPTQAD